MRQLEPRTRMSAAERREEILEAAVTEFALRGLEGTSTDAIARRAGVSQPYLFRLYGTKKDLFLAAVNRGFDRVLTAFRLAAESNPDEPGPAMGQAYMGLLQRREELLLQLQAYAACSDDDVRALVRLRYAGLWEFVQNVAGPDADVQSFFAAGMLLNVATALDLLPLMDVESWAKSCLGPRP